MITRLEPDRVFAIQMNDGTLTPALEDYKIDCLANRVPPGEGEFDCVGFMRTLVAMGVTAPISLEVCSTELWDAARRRRRQGRRRRHAWRAARGGSRGVTARHSCSAGRCSSASTSSSVARAAVTRSPCSTAAGRRATLPADVERLVADRTDAEQMRAALDGRDWDAVFDVSGFVMAAGGSDIDGLLDLLDGHVGALRLHQLDHGLRPVAGRRVPVDRGPADQSRRAGQLRRLQGARRAGDPRPPRRAPGSRRSVVRPAAIYGPDNNIFDMETADVPAAAPAAADPRAARRSRRRVVRSRRRPVRGDDRRWSATPAADGRGVQRLGRVGRRQPLRRRAGRGRRRGARRRARARRDAARAGARGAAGVRAPVQGPPPRDVEHRQGAAAARRHAALRPRSADMRTRTSGSSSRVTTSSSEPLVDPVWKATWDFEHEAAIAGRIRAVDDDARSRLEPSRCPTPRSSRRSRPPSSSAAAGPARRRRLGAGGGDPTRRADPVRGGRGPDRTEARVAELADVLTTLAGNELVATAWNGDLSQRAVMEAAGAVLAEAVGRDDAAAAEGARDPCRARAANSTTSWPRPHRSSTPSGASSMDERDPRPLQRWLGAQDEHDGDVAVVALKRIATGNSRANWYVETADGARYVVRVEQGGVFGSSSGDEFRMMGAAHALGCPVARVRWLEPTRRRARPAVLRDGLRRRRGDRARRPLDGARAGRGLRAPARRAAPRWTGRRRSPASVGRRVRPTPRSTGGTACTGRRPTSPMPLLEEGAAWLHHYAPATSSGSASCTAIPGPATSSTTARGDRVHGLGVRPRRRPDRGLGVPDHDARRIDDGSRRLAGAVRSRRGVDVTDASSTTGGVQLLQGRLRQPDVPARVRTVNPAPNMALIGTALHQTYVRQVARLIGDSLTWHEVTSRGEGPSAGVNSPLGGSARPSPQRSDWRPVDVIRRRWSEESSPHATRVALDPETAGPCAVRG